MRRRDFLKKSIADVGGAVLAGKVTEGAKATTEGARTMQKAGVGKTWRV